MKDFSQNIIKARVAETIIQELFQANNYNVFNFGMERAAPAMLGKIHHLSDDVAKSIRCMPDFVVQNKLNGELYYVEVKFRASGWFSVDELMKDFPYKNAHFIIVSPYSIKAISYKELENGEKLTPSDNRSLANYSVFNLSDYSLDRFMEYVGQFFGFVGNGV